MATRIRVRKGDTEVEYEGSEQFLKTELSSLLRAASSFPSGARRQASPSVGAAGRGRTAAGRGRTAAGRGRTAAGKAADGKKSGRKTSVSAAAVDKAAASRAADALGSGAADIAARIGCRHGTDLVLAAAAQLNLRAARKTFSRAALLGEMKTAAQYYKPVDGKNLSRYLKNLIRERQLNQPRPGIYALTAGAKREMAKILAE